MSRFEETVNEAIDEVVIGEALRVEALAERIARTIVERQRALRSEVTIRASYPVEKRTPVTDIATQEMYGLIGVAAADTDRQPAHRRRHRAGHERVPVRPGAHRRPRPRTTCARTGSARTRSTASCASSRSRPTTSAPAAPSTSAAPAGRRSTPTS